MSKDSLENDQSFFIRIFSKKVIIYCFKNPGLCYIIDVRYDITFGPTQT